MFFSKQDLYSEFDFVYTDLSQIPFDSLKLSETRRRVNGYHFIQESKGNLSDYFLEPFRALQPKTYQYLIEGKFFYAVEKWDLGSSDITQFGIIINDERVCYMQYTPYTYEKGKSDYPTIPLEILNSWLYRAEGWDMAESTVIDIHRGVLPSVITYSMSPICSLIRELADKERRALPQYTDFLEAKFNHAFRQTYQTEEFMDTDKYFELRCLLDTRLSDDWGKNGFQLFVSSHNTERNVYVVPRTDVMQIKKLSHPAEAIDSYAAHLLSGKEGEFDFLQYAEDF